jgi:pyruvate formate lyase activating enzyme
VRTLQQAREIGLEAGLHHVYLGNVAGEAHTGCAECGEQLVRRSGYRIVSNKVKPDGSCPTCGTVLAGVGMAPA